MDEIEIKPSNIENQPPNSVDNDDHHQPQLQPQNKNDEDVLKFMDSLDSYLLLLDSLSSTLRQGWFDFSSARYSMGASRINSVLLDLKEHSAATHLEVTKGDEPHFTLCKWVSNDAACSKKKDEGDCGLQQNSDNLRQRHKDLSQPKVLEDDRSPSRSSNSVDDQVQKERSKSLAVFGTLVSPKLRVAQSSFETALEKLVEIANARASMIHAFEQVQGHFNRVEN